MSPQSDSVTHLHVAPSSDEAIAHLNVNTPACSAPVQLRAAPQYSWADPMVIPY